MDSSRNNRRQRSSEVPIRSSSKQEPELQGRPEIAPQSTEKNKLTAKSRIKPKVESPAKPKPTKAPKVGPGIPNDEVKVKLPSPSRREARGASSPGAIGLNSIEDQLIRQSNAIEKHESQIARHTAIQTWTNIVTLLFGVITTVFLLYLTNNQLAINAGQLAISRRQVGLEYAKAAPVFSVSVARYGASVGPVTARIPVKPTDQESSEVLASYWSIGIHPDRIRGNKRELAKALSRIIGGEEDFFYRRLISDLPFVFLDEDASLKTVIAINRRKKERVIEFEAIEFDRTPATLEGVGQAYKTVPLPRFPKSVSVTLTRGEATIKRVTTTQEITFVLTYSTGEFTTCTVRATNYFSTDSSVNEFPALQIASAIAESNIIRRAGDRRSLIIIPGTTAVEVEYVDVFGKDRAALFSGNGVSLEKVAIARSSRNPDRPTALLADRADLVPPKFLQSLEVLPKNKACKPFI